MIKLWRLKLKAMMLQAQAHRAEALLADHEVRYEMLIRELRRVKIRIATLEKPEVLLRQLTAQEVEKLRGNCFSLDGLSLKCGADLDAVIDAARREKP